MEIQDPSTLIQSLEAQLYLWKTVAYVSRTIFRLLDLKQLLDTTAASLVDPFYDEVHIYLLDDKQEYAVMQAAARASKILVERGYKVKIDTSTVVGWCVQNRKAKIVKSDPVPLFPEPHFAMVLPLVSQGELIGVVELLALHEIPEENLFVFESLADLIAIAIENARSYSQLQETVTSK